MNGKWLSVIALVVVASALLAVSSCGRDQQLVSIQVQPGTETFGASDIPVAQDFGLQVQLRALGTYIHPPVTKDITSEVTWNSNDTQMMTVTPAGLLTATGETCGATLVSATLTTNSSAGGLSSSGALVTGYMTGNVVCFTGSGSGGAGSGLVLTLTFAGGGSGNVTSNPSGLSCTSAQPCLGQFVTGSTIMLTGTPTGSSTSVSWLGCDTPTTTNPCSVTMNANRTVTATFN